MDPLAGIVGAFVIASWSFGLVRDTGAILLDMNPDRPMADNLRQTIEGDGDKIADLHLWRLGSGSPRRDTCPSAHARYVDRTTTGRNWHDSARCRTSPSRSIAFDEI